MERQNLDVKQKENIIKILRSRFDKCMERHTTLTWTEIEKKLKQSPEKLWALNEMEKTGGEPDVIAFDNTTDEYIFYDCSLETPKNRRNVCYDREAQESRKTARPKDNAVDLANKIGIEILTEEEYRQLQNLGEFDIKTSSWIKTPDDIRKLGGALFADRRYNNVFVYHNGAQSYYNSRGFRGKLKV